MPFSDSARRSGWRWRNGLWILREPPKKKSWRTGFSLPVVVSIISIAFSSGLAWFALQSSRINTKIAQRAYLGYKAELVTQPIIPNNLVGPINLEYRIIVTNFGNTPADKINVIPVDYHWVISSHSLPREVIPNAAKPLGPLRPYDFQLGPKETAAVEPDIYSQPPFAPPKWAAVLQTIFPVGPIRISGKILYFDVFGDFHKQYYCAELKPPVELLLTSSPPPAPVIYHFGDCDSFSREEVLPGGPLMLAPWNKESIKKEFDDSFRILDMESLAKEYEDARRKQ